MPWRPRLRETLRQGQLTLPPPLETTSSKQQDRGNALAPRAVQQRQCSRRPQSTGKHAKKEMSQSRKRRHATHTSHSLPSPPPDHALRSRPFSASLTTRPVPACAPSAAGARQPVSSRAATRSDRTGQDGLKIVRAFRIARYLACIPIRVVKSGIDRGFLVSHRSGLAGQPASPNLLDFGTWDSPCLATCLSVPTCLPACRPTERTSRGLHSPRLGDAVTRSRREGKKKGMAWWEGGNTTMRRKETQVQRSSYQCDAVEGGEEGGRVHDRLPPTSPESDQTKRLLLPAGLAMQDFFSKARLPW